MIQLDAAIAQSAMGTAEQQVAANAQTIQTNLENYATYAGAMADYYQALATQYAEAAQSNVVTDKEANTMITENDNKAADTQEELLRNYDLANWTTASNQAGYFADSASETVNSMAQGATQSSQNLAWLTQQSSAYAATMIAQYNEVAKAVAAAGKGEVAGSVIGGSSSGAAPSF